jgi:hypothetical protein
MLAIANVSPTHTLVNVYVFYFFTNISMLINDLHTQSYKPKELKSGAVVNECHKQSSPCSSKDKGSLKSKDHTNKQHNETTN